MPYASDNQRKAMWAKGLAGGETLAKGIPDRSDMGDASKLPVDEPLTVVLQRHLADKAGLHFDLRLGNKQTGLQSWALPKGLPQPGEKRLAVPQPLHAYDYKDFEGVIPEGYGKGTVTNEINGNALITKNDPEQLNFSMIDAQRPIRYSLINTKSGNALALNTTPQTADPAINDKQHYKTVYQDKVKELMDKGYALSPKLDGASEVVEVHNDKLEITSVRKGKDGLPIIHTERIGGLTGLNNPPELVGTKLRAELIGERGGRAITLQELLGMLNSNIIKAINDKKATGTTLKLYAFNQLAGDPLFRKRMQDVARVVAKLKNPALLQAAVLYNRREQQDLYDAVKAGKYPLTTEGFVLTDPDTPNAVPLKAPITNENDVKIEDIIPAVTATGNPRAGAIAYSIPGKPGIVGNVGSGFTRKFAEELPAVGGSSGSGSASDLLPLEPPQQPEVNRYPLYSFVFKE